MNYLSINDMHVDLNRCQLHINDSIISLEPKVTEVLAALARHQGEVVSQQTLLSEVWAGTVVETNALQRCIGQLRKAFDDDAKSPRFIATHPKKGYSLIPEVQWQESIAVSPAHGLAHPSSTIKPPFYQTALAAFQTALAAGVAVLALGILAVSVLATQQKGPETLNTTVEVSARPFDRGTQILPAALRQSSDFFAVYSPDGRYVVYPRMLEKQQGRLWARDLISEREFVITGKEGHYPYSAWSQDSQQIAYVANNVSSGCYSLHTVSVPRNDDTPLSDNQITHCAEATLLSPQWLNDSSLVWIEYKDNHGHIIRHDTTLSSQSTIYDKREKLPYYLSYSPKADKLAIAQITTANRLELAVLDTDSGESSVLYSIEAEAGNSASWHPVWNQDATGVLISSQGKTVNIGLDGTVTQLALPYFPSQGAEL